MIAPPPATPSGSFLQNKLWHAGKTSNIEKVWSAQSESSESARKRKTSPTRTDTGAQKLYEIPFSVSNSKNNYDKSKPSYDPLVCIRFILLIYLLFLCDYYLIL